MMLGFRSAGRRSAGFLLLGVLAVVSLSACETVPQTTPVPQTETSAATQTPTLASTPTPTSSPSPTETLAATQAPILESTPTLTPLPDLVVQIKALLKSNPDIEWGDGCMLSSSWGAPFHVSEITAHVRNVGSGDAGSFTVELNNFVTETVDGLKAGASATVVVSTSARSENVAVVDPDSSIDEADESNNTAQTFMPVPTLVPPPTCTPK